MRIGIKLDLLTTVYLVQVSDTESVTGNMENEQKKSQSTLFKAERQVRVYISLYISIYMSIVY